MRKRNWRFVLAGLFLMMVAAGLFVFVLSIAGQSTDPAEAMRIIGGYSGGLIGVSVALIVIGLIGKKV